MRRTESEYESNGTSKNSKSRFEGDRIFVVLLVPGKEQEKAESNSNPSVQPPGLELNLIYT